MMDWMGKDSGWNYSSLNCAGNLPASSELGRWSTNPMMFSAYSNQLAAAARKRCIVFDQLKDGTELGLSSASGPAPCPGGCGSEEMHENTDEIDALLYSDSEDEASTGHSPLEAITAENVEEVASSSSTMPAKRRRVDAVGPGVSLTDTASSGGAYRSHEEDSAELSLLGGIGGQCVMVGDTELGEEVGSPTAVGGCCPGSKRMKMERIQETICVLRRIIPGGRGMDAAAVLDQAIWYLSSLKLQARAIGAASVL